MRIFQVDAFTSEPYKGNPAAICLLDAPVDDAWMQAVASEMNLSETAFVEVGPAGAAPRGPDGVRELALRWFTPLAEVDLCGHATLATAHVLWELGEQAPRLQFRTRSGLLSATRSGGAISLDFPALAPVAATAPPGLAEAIGADPVFVGRTRFDLFVEVADEDVVRALDPDVGALCRLPARGVIVSAAARPSTRRDGGADFVSRFFAPSVGIDEDPVTGSAHCSLAPYWARRLGRDELLGFQASRRGGIVAVHCLGERVRLTGAAVTVLAGELRH